MSLLEVRALESGYGKTSVLHGVSLTVKENEIVTVVGPNGAGKSTLMKTVIGLLKPKKGKVAFQMEEINGLEPDIVVKRGMGYVPQENNVFSSLTVMENLKIGAYLFGRLEPQLEDVFNRFPILRERKDLKAGSLSGGERQMLAIASSLMLSPKLLLLDEPCSGLAPQIVKGVCNKILEINRMGTAIVWVVEQNPRRAMGFSNRSYVLESGAIKYEGDPEVLLQESKFKNLFFSQDS